MAYSALFLCRFAVFVGWMFEDWLDLWWFDALYYALFEVGPILVLSNVFSRNASQGSTASPTRTVYPNPSGDGQASTADLARAYGTYDTSSKISINAGATETTRLIDDVA